MARTKQTARRSVDDDENPPDEEEQKEMEERLTEEDKKRREELEKLPMQAEVKHLEKRWTKKGRGYITEPKDDDDDVPNGVNWHEKFALCVIRTYDNSNKYVHRTALQVNSPSLKAILKEIIDIYPGQSFHTSQIEIPFPAHCLYHYQEDLQDKLDDLNDPEYIPPTANGKAKLTNGDVPHHPYDVEQARAHLPVLLNFIKEHFEEEIAELANTLPQGMISFSKLWMIFRPGIKVFAYCRGQPRVYKLTSYNYECGIQPCLALNVEYVDYDGSRFGTRHTRMAIPEYGGAVEISCLNCLPLTRHPSLLEITKSLIKRGQKWESINQCGQKFMEYSGTAISAGCIPHRYNISSRVMIDCATFHRIEADESFSVNGFPMSLAQKAKATLLANNADYNETYTHWGPNGEKIQLVDREPLTDEQCLLASPILRGFAFTEKLFLEFFVDSLTEVDWNTSCFEQLVLPTSQKELVQALVAEHTSRALPSTSPNGKQFDDIIKNKGLGLILVLHGPPGVGKTLTAECVAEFSKRPLYIVSSGDLGTNATDLDCRLTKILDLASTWRAVLLIDEADVFLERRSLKDMERNSLVSIFLRTLEYYSGILFMTTNRVRTFDDAFKSRIHVPLKYDDLPQSSRVKIWRNFIAKLKPATTITTDTNSDTAANGTELGVGVGVGVNGHAGIGVEVDVDEAGYEKLAEKKLNGRQIKNVVRTAKSLAAYRGGKLDVEALMRVVDIQMAFEEELRGDDVGKMDVDEE